MTRIYHELMPPYWYTISFEMDKLIRDYEKHGIFHPGMLERFNRMAHRISFGTCAYGLKYVVGAIGEENFVRFDTIYYEELSQKLYNVVFLDDYRDAS